MMTSGRNRAARADTSPLRRMRNCRMPKGGARGCHVAWSAGNGPDAPGEVNT